jgi:4-amino-4-deoxy-L-arabinose transferase-like glycosyltransferase
VEGENRGVMNGLVRTPEGRLVLQYPPGILALDALPFLAGRALDRGLPARWMARGADLPPAGRVPRGVFLSAAMIVLARNGATLLGLLWIARALRRMGTSEGIAAAAVALAFFGGPLIFYSLVGMSHAPAFALAALLLLALVRQREAGSARLALAAGAIVGAAVLVRYGSIALAAPALVAIAWETGEGGRRKFHPAAVLAFAAGLAVVLLPLPLWWAWLFGSWRPPYGGTWMISAASPWNVLFSPVHGLFWFHPALLLAAAGLTIGVRRLKEWRIVAAVWFLAVAVLYGWWSEWSNPGGYGQRFLIDALPALAVGFAAFLEGGRLRLKATVAAAAALLGYLLFFAAVGGLASPPAGVPWPQRWGDYAPLLRHPPGPAGMADALRRASLPVRAVAGPAR